MIHRIVQITLLLLTLVAFGALPTVNQLRVAHSIEECSDAMELETVDEIESSCRSESFRRGPRCGLVNRNFLRPAFLPNRTLCVISEWNRFNGLGTYLRT